MRRPRPTGLKVGQRIGSDVTVLGAVAERRRRPVYVVWHDKLWCPLACKVLASPRAAQHEAQVLASLSHPYIVRSFGTYAARYLLIEYLEGPTLSRVLENATRGRLDVSDAVRAAIYIGAALAHVHRRGFVHLDVKPSNVAVVRNRPVLFDFGLARRLDGRRPRHIHGTDPYIAPEECLLAPITPAADVFGLGVTLYEMLAGQMPFPDASRKNPFPQVDGNPTSLRKHRRSAPAELDQLIFSCLASNPRQRPKLSALLPALHRFVSKGPRMWPGGFEPVSKHFA
jgi:serine/threonine protein kinase